MRCRLCHSPDLSPVPFEVPSEAGRWLRCDACESDTAAHGYPDRLYVPGYDAAEVAASGGEAVRDDSIRSNLDWFGHHHTLGDDRTALDVGCCDGAGLRGLAALGWSVHGWDVFRPPYYGPHVTVSPVFSRWLFPRRYAVVLCREVLEHTETPHLLLHELHGVAAPGGLVQVQTPVPLAGYHPIPYQRPHLFLASRARLRAMLDVAMFDVVDERHWDLGQAYLCRARG